MILMKKTDGRIYQFTVSVVLLLLVCAGIRAQNPLPNDFDQWIEAGMEQWNIPGMAIVIVKDDSIFLMKGYGVRKLGEAAKVNEHSLFGIASVSKHMTSTALAILVDEGKLSWDDRVADIIPWFELSDPWVTAHVTVRDLLTHRVGVGRMLGNRLQFMTDANRDDVIRAMKYHEFEKPFRSGFVYSNVMYSTAGQLIEYITGTTWDAFLKSRLFEPLGMQNTNTSITAISRNTNAAWPHQEIEKEVIAIPRRNWDNAGPAGGVNSTMHDLALWLRFQLGTPGSLNETELVQSATMHEIHKPQVSLGSTGAYGAQVSYGLGLYVRDYNGTRMLSHGGATDGFNTSAYLLPEHNLGIVVVSNVFSRFNEAVCMTIIDDFLQIDNTNWNDQYFKAYESLYESTAKHREEIHANRKPDMHPRLALEYYTGNYNHPLYTKAVVSIGPEGLELQLWDNPDLIADLEHWHYDTFRAIWRNPAMREEFVSFTYDKQGHVNEMHIEFSLRPGLLQVGVYPSPYTRLVKYSKTRD
jgi:CubicO group peptidase (beta-lactamase class C family)